MLSYDEALEAAGAYVAQGDFERANTACQRARALDPGASTAALLSAEIALQMGRFAEAREL